MLLIPDTVSIILFLNFSCLIVVKNPGLFFILICFFLYKLCTTSRELTTSANFVRAFLSSILKLFTTASIISSSSFSLFKRSIINASILSISL